MKRMLAIALSVIVMTVVVGARPANSQDTEVPTPKASQKNQEKALKWKERILKVPVGSYVKGKLENYVEFEGQLRDITDSTFAVQCLKNGKIETIAIPYEQMKSLSVAGQPSTGEKVAKTLLSF